MARDKPADSPWCMLEEIKCSCCHLVGIILEYQDQGGEALWVSMGVEMRVVARFKEHARFARRRKEGGSREVLGSCNKITDSCWEIDDTRKRAK